MAFRFQLRRDTALVWSAVDPVLLIGELAYETDTNRMKIGDGATPWNDLPYFLDSVYSVNGQAGYVMLYTDDIPEGATAINKWYSNDLVADLLQAGDGVTLDYNATGGTLTISASGSLSLPGDGLLSLTPSPIQDVDGVKSSLYLATESIGVSGNFGVGTLEPSAIVQIDSTTSGLVIPRMTGTQKNAIAGPTGGMIIYQTDGVEGVYQYKASTGWESIDPGDISGTINYVSKFTSGNVIGDSLIYDSGSVISIGTTGATASAIFQVDSTTKGVLIPRVTESQRISIASPAGGLLVTETGPTGGLNQYIDSIGWVQYIHNNGGVTGGTQYIYGDLTIYGTLSATAKSFFIDNPKKPGEKLIYGVSEAPEHSVFYRGRSSDKIIKLPEEWEWLVDDNTITVQLTCIGKILPLVVDSIGSKEIGVKIDSWNPVINKSKLDYYYYIQAERKDIPKLKTK